MQIAPSTYYAAKSRPPSARAVADAQRLEMIRQVHTDNYGVYGVRKMHAELNRRGHRIARCTVHRLMRAEGLRGISRAKGRAPRSPAPARMPARTCWTATSGHLHRIVSGLRTSPNGTANPGSWQRSGRGPLRFH